MLAFRQPILVLLLFSIFIAVVPLVSNSHDDAADLSVSEWSIAWIQKPNPSGSTPPADLFWHSATAQRPLTALPDGAVGAWVRVPIPPTAGFNDPGLYIRQLYGLDITVYEDARAIYHSSRNYDFERNILLIPLTSKSASSEIYIVMKSKEGAGINSEIRVGEFADLSSSNARKGLPNVLLGAAIAFLGFIMLLSTGFFVRSLTKPANALSLFILSTGLLIVTNSSLPYFYFPDYGQMLFFLFDTFLLVLFPSLFYFVSHSFELTNSWLKKSQSWLIGYSGASFLVMLVYKGAGGSFYFYYKLFTFWILAPLVLAQLVVILIFAIRNLFRKSRSSMLLSTGIIGLAISGVADFIVLSYRQSPYQFELWKFGIVFLVACLVMALNRRIAADYAKLLAYSNELELYNHQLQKSERMQIISQLAASIAHEVRNPLQVTRGFLQLLSRKSTETNKYQYDIAISELDRAAGIITDYLTFAKPEQETPAAIDVKQELSIIETILLPMVMMHSGVLLVKASEHLTIIGNTSKFKQALINIMKNSIESLKENGKIELEAYEENDEAVIRITDNGQGMSEEQLAKLGNPYFSSKSEGTGLGLMVTFQIIEAMNGTLTYRSEKGKGTEAMIRFPLVR